MSGRALMMTCSWQGTAGTAEQSDHNPATGVAIAPPFPVTAVDIWLPEQTSLLGGLQFLSVEIVETRFYKLTLLVVKCSADSASLK